MEASCSLSRSTAAPRYQPGPEEKSLSVLSRTAPASSRAASPRFARIQRTRSPRTSGSERSAHSTATIVPLLLSHACATEGWRAKVCRIGFALTPQPNPATASHPRGTLNRPMRSGVSSRCSTLADRARQADGNCGLAVTCYPGAISNRLQGPLSAEHQPVDDPVAIEQSRHPRLTKERQAMGKTLTPVP